MSEAICRKGWLKSVETLAPVVLINKGEKNKILFENKAKMYHGYAQYLTDKVKGSRRQKVKGITKILIAKAKGGS